jgi:hypothetical protein
MASNTNTLFAADALPPPPSPQYLSLYQIAESTDHPNSRVCQKKISAHCVSFWGMEMFTETARKGIDPTYDPGHASFWKQTTTAAAAAPSPPLNEPTHFNPHAKSHS